jgi:hypothetical protein
MNGGDEVNKKKLTLVIERTKDNRAFWITVKGQKNDIIMEYVTSVVEKPRSILSDARRISDARRMMEKRNDNNR